MLQIVFVITSCILLLSYIALVTYFSFGWDKIKEERTSKNSYHTLKLSCIIPFRDEEDNLPQLIHCLNKQIFPDNNFEAIFVDDNSIDDSYQVVLNLIKGHKNYSVIKSLGEGKKKAISSAINTSKFDYIITTDADCIFHTQWLNSIGQYIIKFSPDLLIGPVALKGANNFFNQFQILDFLSLVTSGAGTVGIRNPIMCNGANLIVKKEVIMEAQHTIHNNYASGDDIFLLQYCKKKKKTIHFLKSKDAIVQSHTVNNLKQFFNQRVRWASKSKGYSDIFTLCVAWIVFLSNALMIIVPIYAFVNIKSGVCLLLLGLLKTILDYYLLKKGAAFFQQKLSLKQFIFAQTVYPFYIISTVFWAAFGVVHWKKRKV